MSVKAVIKDFAAACLETDYLGARIGFSEAALPVGNPALTGELLTYYRHLYLPEETYFGNGYFNLVCLPERTRPNIGHCRISNSFTMGNI